jgi:hypothetical protein
MSFWDPWGIASTTYHAVTGAPTAAERRAAQNAMQSQINFYKNQTEITNQEINEKRAQEATEKRRVEEKQIRALRGSHGVGGLMDSPDIGPTDQNDLSNKLGG